MFGVKVKTLDGRTHEFSVPDTSTVLQFKEIINEKMSIAIEQQRLLYQGRVLIDENLLSSYEVAGNVMHLVTRPPPQSRPMTEPTVEREENSDINRDQIRNILSDVLNNIGDLNNPMGVSVNNDGNRMDITVNIPSQNRLSLSRLRQNYIMRLLRQARDVINHMEDPSRTSPRPDRDSLRQADPYDIGQNEERLTEISSEPLPISNLADMILLARSLWVAAEPQLQLWESVLRRENAPDTAPRADIEMQRIHDSASRYVHLFSHILHILSDYLVEFHPTATATRSPSAQTTAETPPTVIDAATSVSVDENNSPLTNACGESGMVGTPLAEAPTQATAATGTTSDAPADIGDRSRYLYVFSEMPAQLVQVRLDVDSNIRDLGTLPTAPIITTHTNVQLAPPRTTETAPTTESSENTARAVPSSAGSRPHSQRRTQPNGNIAENLFRTTFQESTMGSNTRPQMANGSRSMRSSPQFLESVDPYVRCQSRHFQHPSILRSGAVISTIGGIRVRDGSRTRHAATYNHPEAGANNTTTPMANVRSQSTDTDPMQSLLTGLMSSFFEGPGDSPRPATTATGNVQAEHRHTNTTPNIANDMQRIIQTLSASGGANLNLPLTQVFPEMLSSHELDPENHVTNQIVHIVINRLTLADLMAIVRGQYTSLNQLRVPLQTVLTNHQRVAGSRELLIDNVVSDLEFFNRAYIAVFEQLRNGQLNDRLSEEARNSFNMRLDIFQTINNLNRYHFQSMIDMIMRSPTNQGFGQLLMNSLTLHHNESLALIDIICNNNDELRQFLIKSSVNSLISSMNPGADANTTPNQNLLGLDMFFDDINSGLFRRPEMLAELREHTLTNFAVYFSENGNAATSASNDESVANVDSIEDMVTNLSEHIINGAIVTELERPSALLGATGNGVDTSIAGQGEGHGASWQSTVPPEWVHVISRDSSGHTASSVPFSDAYVSGMTSKRRKVIVSQRSVQSSCTEMMYDCLDQAIKDAGLASPAAPDCRTLLPASVAGPLFRDVVTERIRRRLTDETNNFASDRFPHAEHSFTRKKCPDQ